MEGTLKATGMPPHAQHVQLMISVITLICKLTLTEMNGSSESSEQTSGTTIHNVFEERAIENEEIT